MGRSKLFTFFLLGMFMLSFVSAWQSDNFIKDEDKINKLQTKTNYGKYIIEDTSWYDPLGIWTKKKTKEVTLKNNSDFCGEDCFAIKEIKNFEEGSLIDDIRFYRIYEDGSQQLSNIRSYQISYWGEDGWINYELGKIMPIGVYKIKLEGKKKPSWTYDWQVLLGGTGVWSEEWAVWGNISLGDDAEVILNSPASNTIFYTPLQTFNCSSNITGGAVLTNISLWTNETGNWEMKNTTDTFQLDLTENQINGGDMVLRKTYETNNNTVKNINWWLVSNFGSQIQSEIRLNYTDGTTATSSLKFTSSTSYVYFTYNNPNPTKNVEYVSMYALSTGTDGKFKNVSIETDVSTNTWSRTITDPIIWTCQACDSDGDCGFAGENRTLSIDVGVPNITIETPTGTLNYGVIGNSETLNVTFTDINLESCWYDYNGTNITIPGCLTGVKNSTTFILEVKNYNMTIYANDSVGNLNFSFIEWEYKLLKSSEVYSNTTRSGSIEDFILNVTLGTGYDLTSASLIYGNETLSPSIVSSGQDRIISVSGYNIPLYQVDTNVSFYWEILLDDSTEINTTTNIQQVQAISLDNCSVYTYELFNLSLYTEREKTPLLGDIELNFQLLNYPDYEVINSLIINIENISTTKVCSDINLSLEDLYYSAEIRYSSEDYASELYHIQRAILPSTIQNIDLYDLNSNFSTEFKVTYQDSTFNFIEGAVIQLQRKYIAEGIYETVEAPLTSNDGIAIVHIDLDTVKYRATVVKDGVVLDEFDNLVLKCQSELTGECEQKLLGTIDPQNNIDLDTTRDFSYSIDRTDNVITTSFTIPSGTPSSVNFQLVQKDQFGSSEMCNKTITSSAGSLQCTFNDTIGDSYIDLAIYKNAEPMAIQTYIIPEASGVDFLGNNYIIIVVLLLSIVGMALTSPEWIIINGIIVMVISGALWLASGLDFVMGLGSLMWLIIAAGILIFKLAKQEDR